jgi:hypothetical protein
MFSSKGELYALLSCFDYIYSDYPDSGFFTRCRQRQGRGNGMQILVRVRLFPPIELLFG